MSNLPVYTGYIPILKTLKGCQRTINCFFSLTHNQDCKLRLAEPAATL